MYRAMFVVNISTTEGGTRPIVGSALPQHANVCAPRVRHVKYVDSCVHVCKGGHLGLGADAEPVGESACPPSCVLVKRTWSLDQQVLWLPLLCLLMQIYFPNISLV